MALEGVVLVPAASLVFLAISQGGRWRRDQGRLPTQSHEPILVLPNPDAVEKRLPGSEELPDFKVQARQDKASGKWFAELYYPEVLSAPIARTRPIFDGMEQALAGALRAMRKGLEQAGALNGAHFE